MGGSPPVYFVHKFSPLQRRQIVNKLKEKNIRKLLDKFHIVCYNVYRS